MANAEMDSGELKMHTPDIYNLVADMGVLSLVHKPWKCFVKLRHHKPNDVADTRFPVVCVCVCVV